jgi:hypothetical protein
VIFFLKKLQVTEMRFGKMTSVRELTCLPQSICRLATCLQELKIVKGLVSLGELIISNCPGIQSLPEGIKGLTALKELWIFNCPDLERRCERETGEDWHLISHIPHLYII